MIQLAQADAARIPLPDNCVSLVCTSPPFWGLRSYAGEQVLTWGGDAGCSHVWGDECLQREDSGYHRMDWTTGGNPAAKTLKTKVSQGQFCQRCHAWCGALGLEPTPDLFIEHLVEVFRDVRRVLAADGLCLVNLGDSYANVGKWGGATGGKHVKELHGDNGTRGKREWGNLKPKDLCLIPQRAAIALQADGWWVRSFMPWTKNNCLPECLDPNTRIFVRENDRVSQVAVEYALDKKGLEILTPTGWRKIIKAWETFKDERVTFEAAKVSVIKCSKKHLWPISHERRTSAIYELRTDDLRDEGYRDYLLHYAIDQFLEPTIHSLWTQELDYDFGWLIGMYAAEGGFDGRRGHRCKFTLHKDEVDFAGRIDRIASGKFNATSSHKEIDNYRIVRFSNFEFRALVDMILPGKCKTKELNLGIILNAPREFRQGIWDGYIAGDGSKREAGVTATSASARLRDTMAVLGSSIGIITSKKTNQRYDKRTGKTYTSYQFWTPYIERRQKKKGQNARQITIRNKRVERGKFRMIDLQVDGGLFLIEDGIATHNSVRDRPTTSHEYWIMLVKSKRYFWDQEGIRVSHAKIDRRFGGDGSHYGTGVRYHDGVKDIDANVQRGVWLGQHPSGRNRRTSDTWLDGLDAMIDEQRRYLAHLEEIRDGTGMLAGRDGEPLGVRFNTASYAGSHFATFPSKMIVPFIRAGSSERGCCPVCRRAWVRVVERELVDTEGWGAAKKDHTGALLGAQSMIRDGKGRAGTSHVTTTGWRHTCACQIDGAIPLPIPALILDPFVGSGTTLEVARALGRDAIGFDLSFPYLRDQARERLSLTALDAWESGIDGGGDGQLAGLPMFDGAAERGS